MDWGHTKACACGICITLPRVHDLISQGSWLSGFVGSASNLLRGVEADLRDELSRRGFADGKVPAQFRRPLPPLVLGGPAPICHLVPPPPPLPVAPDLQGEGKEASQAAVPQVSAEEGKSKEKDSQAAAPNPVTVSALIFPKSGPSPYKNASLPATRVKEEGSEEKPEKEGFAPKVKPGEEPENRATSSGREKKKRHTSRSRKASRESRKREKAEKKHKRRDRSEESPKGVSSTPREKERKRRRSPTPEEVAEEEKGGASSSRTPRPPNHPPPQRENQSGGHRQGPGWRGPRLDPGHWRWNTGKNKGVVKRQKQDAYRQRYRG